MEDLLSVRRTTVPILSNSRLPKECRRHVFVPAHGNDKQQYCFLIDLDHMVVTTWVINMDTLILYLNKWFYDNLQEIYFPINEPLKKYLYGRLRFHTARFFRDKIYLYPINGFFFLCLDLNSDDYTILYEDPATVYCPTNSINNGEIFFTKWNVVDAFTRKRQDDNIPLTFGKYNIEHNRFVTLKQIEGPDNIHDTVCSPNGRYVIAVEMPRTVPVPPSDKLTADNMRLVLAGGIGKSRIIRYDIVQKQAEWIYTTKSPSHIVFDKRNPDIAYIADSNLWVSYCFGTGRIEQYNFRKGIELVGSYEADDFYRIPSHDILLYNNKSFMCTTVFSNQVHLLDTDGMTLTKRIYLSDKRRVPDFSRGPYQYPNHDRTPYTLHPIDGTPYLILASLWGVWILNTDNEKIIAKIRYNDSGYPTSSMGHSICF